MTTAPTPQMQPGVPAPQEDVLLEVNGLKMYFPVTSGIVFQRKIADVKAVDDVSFFIKPGETLGLVGESGSGKTTVGRCILQLHRPTSGRVIFQGKDLTEMNDKALRSVRRDMQVIFQDPYGSLNPRLTCGDIIGEPLVVHKLTSGKGEYGAGATWRGVPLRCPSVTGYVSNILPT